MAIDAGVTKEAMMKMNRLGVCLHPSTKPKLLKEVGDHFQDSIIEGLKNGKTYRCTARDPLQEKIRLASIDGADAQVTT